MQIRDNEINKIVDENSVKQLLLNYEIQDIIDLRDRPDKGKWLNSLETMSSYMQNKLNLYVDIDYPLAIGDYKGVVDIEEDKRYYMTLTEFDCFIHFWHYKFCTKPVRTKENDYFFKRIKDRNSCLEII